MASARAAAVLPALGRPTTSLPPGPRWPALAQTVAWAVSLPWVLDRCGARYGEMFTVRFFPSGRRMVIVSGAETVKQVFTAPPEVAPSAAGMSPIAPVMGPSSVLTLTGPEHIRQRRLLLPPFHGERMKEYGDVVVEATKRDVSTWPLGEPMCLQERTRAITLEVILRAVFGVEAERMGRLREAIGALFEPLRLPMLLRIALSRPTLERPQGSFGRALDRLDEVIYAEIARRREQVDLGERRDILSQLLLAATGTDKGDTRSARIPESASAEGACPSASAHDEDGVEMTDAELRDELVTLLLAGHETTATSVAWAIERLVRHPEKLARLTAEIDAGEGDEYMQAVAHETLRVRPVVPMVVRVLEEPLRVGEHELPRGTRVAPSIYLTNRDPRVYESPREFLPERFLGSQPETFSWIPFGGGIRRCIGASFALLEMKLMLRTLLSDLEPSLPRARSWRGRLPLSATARGFAAGERNRRRGITLVPANGARVVWSRRR